MSSTSDEFIGRSAITFVDQSPGGPPLFGAVARRQFVREAGSDTENVLACAAAAMARVEQEIDHLWRDAMRAADRAMSQRLAEVSHALRRAARLLEHHDAIG
jgi:hypothetical protein